MNKVIVYTAADGMLCIVVPCAPPLPAETEEQYLARIAARDVPAGLKWRAADRAELPRDRSDRAAWADTGAKVEVSATRKAALDAGAARAKRAEVNRRRAELGFDPLPD